MAASPELADARATVNAPLKLANPPRFAESFLEITRARADGAPGPRTTPFPPPEESLSALRAQIQGRPLARPSAPIAPHLALALWTEGEMSAWNANALLAAASARESLLYHELSGFEKELAEGEESLLQALDKLASPLGLAETVSRRPLSAGQARRLARAWLKLAAGRLELGDRLFSPDPRFRDLLAASLNPDHRLTGTFIYEPQEDLFK